jgi:hypothetical protein
MRHWINWKLHYWRCELIYTLGGVPKEHIPGPNGAGVVHYRNIESVVANIKAKIDATTSA